MPCDSVHWVLEDDDHSFWLYTACGLVRIARPELDAWATDPKRDRPDHRLRQFRRSQEPCDSVATPACRQVHRWEIVVLAARDGVSVIDPHHLPFNKLPPPVQIEQITADRHSARYVVRASPATAAAESAIWKSTIPRSAWSRRRRFFFASSWKATITIGRTWAIDRQAFYTNLPPRNYRFRVIACNNSGVWNEAGASFDFSIAPAYYQTAWFQASCAAAFLGLLWALYRYRLHQIAREFNARLEERVNERTRIARDLHDTLLQSFHGLMFRFQAARNMLPRRPEEAMQALDTALERTEQAIAEGRDAIQGLRASTVVTNELAQAVTALGEELASAMARGIHRLSA